MFLQINAVHPEERKIRQVVEVVKAGGILIYPTDTVYGLGCSMFQHKAVERICHLSKLDPSRAMLSFICKDISQIAEYAWQLDNDVFKLLKKNLPGPFTFVLRSGNAVPKFFKNRKRTIGVRIPDNRIALALVEALGHPLLTTSLKSGEEFEEYPTDPIDIYEDFQKLVDVVIDGGMGGTLPSTLVDCTTEPFEIIRQGAGILRF